MTPIAAKGDLMMKKAIFTLLLVLLMIAGTAFASTLPGSLTSVGANAFDGDVSLSGRVVLPSGVTSVGSRAFAATRIHALVVNEGLASLPGDVLEGGRAAYVMFKGANTTVSGTLSNVPLVFAPAGSSLSSHSGFYATENLVAQDGWYYYVTEGEAIPLCAVDGTAVSGVYRVPKLVDGQPVKTLEHLCLKGCGSVTGLEIPSYLTPLEDMPYTTYDAITVEPPMPDVTETDAGKFVTWTTSVTNTYGDVAYFWQFNCEGEIFTRITASNVMKWYTMVEGDCVATVTVVDALDDRAGATGPAVKMNPPKPVYRALLVGNTYSDTIDPLQGCDTDVRAMRTVLDSMSATPYRTNVQYDLTASQIRAQVSATFADANGSDISLFHFSGHASSSGSLAGAGNTSLKAADLKKAMDKIPGTKVLIIDACYSGVLINKSGGSARPSAFNSAFISPFSSVPKDDFFANDGYIVMTSCSKEEFSQTLSDGTVSFGAFTYGVCYGSGFDEWNQTSLGNLPADADGNGQITLGEAMSTARSRVSWLATLVEGMDQNAQSYGDSSFVLWAQ